jgi:hypothetical protein
LRSGLLGPALLSASAGAIHLAVAPQHLRESPALGELFVVLGAAQLAWAVLAAVRPRRPLLWAAAGANALVAVLWAVSRTAGLPPLVPAREAVGVLDVLATACEVTLAAFLCSLLLGRDRPARDPAPALDAGLAIGAGAVPLTVLALSLGLTGDGHGHGAGAASPLVQLAHHGAHLLVLGVAFAVFTGYLAVFVRRNGWPGFAWRLRPQEG